MAFPENIGMDPGEHEVSPGFMADQVLTNQATSSPDDFGEEIGTGRMLSPEEAKKRRAEILKEGRDWREQK